MRSHSLFQSQRRNDSASLHDSALSRYEPPQFVVCDLCLLLSECRRKSSRVWCDLRESKRSCVNIEPAEHIDNSLLTCNHKSLRVRTNTQRSHCPVRMRWNRIHTLVHMRSPQAHMSGHNVRFRNSTQFHVRFGSKADICAAKCHVRFTPESGHRKRRSECLLSARSGHCSNSTRRHGLCLSADKQCPPNHGAW